MIAGYEDNRWLLNKVDLTCLLFKGIESQNSKFDNMWGALIEVLI